MGQNTVHLPAGFLQIPDRFLVIFLRRQFLRPPGDAFYPEHLLRPALEPIFPLKAGRRGVKDTVLDIVGGRAANGEEGQPANFEDLSTHKMDHMGADIVDLPAVPGVNRQSVQLIKVFVVSVYKKGRERPVFQPVEPVCLSGGAVPYASMIAADNHGVLSRH